MFHTNAAHIQEGRGFHVDRYPIQRGRGLGGIFSSIFRKLVPFGKSFAKGALSAGKEFVKSDTGKSIIQDTIGSAANAATSALIDNDPEEAKMKMVKSFKRSGKKTKGVLKKIAKAKLEKVLTGKGVAKSSMGIKKQKGGRVKLKSLIDLL